MVASSPPGRRLGGRAAEDSRRATDELCERRCARRLPRATAAAQKKLSKAQKDAIVFTPFIIESITGMLLGDGFLQIMGKDARLQIDQKDREFAYNLWSLFDRIGIVGATPSEQKDHYKTLR